MAQTRTWLTTPEGRAPLDDDMSDETWVAGPSIPTEPRPPSRFRGLLVLVVVYAVAVGLTLAIAPALLDTQDPTFGGEPEQPETSVDDPTLDRPADT